MLIGDSEQFASAVLYERLVATLGDQDIGNGTPAAATVATALAIDQRISGRRTGSEDSLLALTDLEILDLAADLAWTFKTKGASFALPLGTKVVALDVSNVRIGEETWVLDAGRPGLHPVETTRRDAHGPNLELLRHHVAHLTRKLACRRIGLPDALLVADRHLLQFPPLLQAGNVVLQRSANGTDAPRFCAALPEQILELAESIVKDMRFLWKRRHAVGTRADKVRAVVEAKAADHGAGVLLLSVDLSHQQDSDEFDLYVHYQGVDDAMRVGPVLDFIPYCNDPELRFYDAPYGLTARLEDLQTLRLLGADGRISDMAAALADAAPCGRATVFHQLACRVEVTFELPSASGRLFATLFWKDGTINAEVSMAGKLDYFRSELEIQDVVLPETLLASLPGRTVSSFAELPFPCDCVVSSVKRSSPKGIRLTLRPSARLVNLSLGRIWDEPT